MPIKMEGPDPVDVHVGRRVRLRRKGLGISQAELAGHIGLTFQQIQKYERGSNRISVSKLYRIAEALRAPVSLFFEGLPAPDTVQTGKVDRLTEAIDRLLITPGGGEVAEAFIAMDPAVRRPFVGLAQAVARREPLDL